MPLFTYMKIYCPICRGEYDGMRPYGKCCCKKCNDEYEWRKTLAICGEEYRPQNINKEILDES
jgi:hypothetical protein